MMAIRDLTGQRFHRLAVIQREGSASDGKAMWRVLCDCGMQKIVIGRNLTTGNTTSCGCFNKEVITSQMMGRQYGLRHGHGRRGKNRTPTYQSWSCMIQRCMNPNQEHYPLYGAKGITVCERWLTFENFLADMGERPPGTTLSRFGDTGNYEPGNCAWHTWSQQRCEAKMKAAA
jgi:hypothetical protein